MDLFTYIWNLNKFFDSVKIFKSDMLLVVSLFTY